MFLELDVYVYSSFGRSDKSLDYFACLYAIVRLSLGKTMVSIFHVEVRSEMHFAAGIGILLPSATFEGE